MNRLRAMTAIALATRTAVVGMTLDTLTRRCTDDP
jgi:hypothetical protein